MREGNLRAFALAIGAVALLVCASAPAPGGATRRGAVGKSTQNGTALAGGAALHPATVTLYRAGLERRSGAVALASAPTNATGGFQIEYSAPKGDDFVLYLVAEGDLGDVKLVTVLGPSSVSPRVTMNERTTVAAVYTMAQFIDDGVIGGYPIGVRNAGGIFGNLVNRVNGNAAKFLQLPPNGLETSTLRKFNSLANMLAAAASSGAARNLLFSLATPEGGEAPTNTLEAMINIAHDPAHNFGDLWLLSKMSKVFQPTIQAPPPDWTLAIKYVGNGHQFAGPGQCAFDEQGNAWVNNNYTPRPNPFLRACGSHLLTKFNPMGENIDGSPFIGGGLDGAGFGICLDPTGDVWVSNFGFYGTGCPEALQPAANSVSRFSADGTALSPDITGYTQGSISSPQGTISDHDGTIWIANTCNGTVTQYIGGDPDNNFSIPIDAGACSRGEAARPFAVAIDHEGGAWVTDNANYAVFRFDGFGSPVGEPICGKETGIIAPMGIAVDSLGNVWVSNSGFLPVPCPRDGLNVPHYGSLVPTPENASVTRLNPDGSLAGVHTGAGLYVPWGVAVDGDDHIWVANFGGMRVSKLCGANAATIPAGKSAGDPLSPENGFQFDGLVRNTGVSIDPSGNVWLTNNWLEIPIQSNPGGDGMVVFLGMAAPVVTPLIGPVRSP